MSYVDRGRRYCTIFEHWVKDLCRVLKAVYRLILNLYLGRNKVLPAIFFRLWFDLGSLDVIERVNHPSFVVL